LYILSHTHCPKSKVIHHLKGFKGTPSTADKRLPLLQSPQYSSTSVKSVVQTHKLFRKSPRTLPF